MTKYIHRIRNNIDLKRTLQGSRMLSSSDWYNIDEVRVVEVEEVKEEQEDELEE